MTLTANQRTVVIVVAALLLVPVIGSTIAGNPTLSPLIITLGAVLGVTATLAIAAALRLPVAATYAGGIAVAAYVVLGFMDGPIMIVAPLTAFVAGLTLRPTRHAVPLAVSIALVVAGILARPVIHTQQQWDGTAWQAGGTVALIAGSASIAWWLRSWQEVRRERRRRGASDERLQMAQDLHDHVGHGLAVIAMQAGVALHVLDSDPAAARRALEAVRDTSRLSLESLRSQLTTLTSTAPPTAPHHGLAQLAGLVERVRAAGLDVVLRTDHIPDLPADVGSAAYLIVQEAATNALRHADARVLTIVVRREDADVVIDVTDDGRIQHTSGSMGSGLGLRSMSDRAQALGGSLQAGPASGGGFALHASLPMAGARTRPLARS